MEAAATYPVDRAAFVSEGCLFVEDGEFFTENQGWFVVNIADGRHLTNHPDARRLAGCCGLDGCDGANKVCTCGAEVAIERSDCWMPHALLFDPKAVEIVRTESGSAS